MGKDYSLPEIADRFTTKRHHLSRRVKKLGLKKPSDLAIEEFDRCRALELSYSLKDIASVFGISRDVLWVALYQKGNQTKMETKKEITEQEDLNLKHEA